MSTDNYDIEVRHLARRGRLQVPYERYKIIASVRSGEPVGHVNIWLYKNNVAEVVLTNVEPDWRRKGVATALYKALYEWANKNHVYVKHQGFTNEGAATVKALRERGIIPKRRVLDSSVRRLMR